MEQAKKWKTKEKRKRKEKGKTESEKQDLERFRPLLTPPPRERETYLATHIATYLAESQ